MKSRGSIAARVMGVVLLSGLVSGAIALVIATRVMCDTEVTGGMVRAIGWTAGLALALALVVAWLLARWITRPIRGLAAAVSGGRDALVLPELPDDEIGQLGRAIAKMHADLARHVQLLSVGADLARDVVRVQDPDEIIVLLAAALDRAHPSHGWRVLLRDDADLALATHDARIAERHVVELTDDSVRIGVAIGYGTIDADEGSSVEVLCHTALAAIRALSLARAAKVNDQLALVGRVSAGITHEINNPLAFVALNLGVLEEDCPDGIDREVLRDTISGVERVAQIVRDLGQLSRRRSEKMEPADLTEIAGEQIVLARGRARGVIIELAAPEPVWTTCSRVRTGQALLNLIVNAIDATAGRRDARVVVEVSEVDGIAIANVRDNGSGIADQIRHKLFDAFATTKGDQGTGLGLHLSRQFMREQGGDLEIVTTGQSGTTFALRLPACQPNGTVLEVASAQGSRPIRIRRILIIDDEPLIVQTLERWLSRYAEVITARDGRDGLARFGEAYYSLVLCDWNMPGSSGRDFLDGVLASRPEALDRLVIMTGGQIDEALPVRVMAKPLDRAAIKQMLRV